MHPKARAELSGLLAAYTLRVASNTLSPTELYWHDKVKEIVVVDPRNQHLLLKQQEAPCDPARTS